MAIDSAALIVKCQMALGITQRQMADMLGKDRRTIQRWQERGCTLLPKDAETLARALRPAHPDLADSVVALGNEMATALGMPRVASPEVIDEILRAAAQAGSASPESIRPAITAAFLKATQAGVDAKAVLAGLLVGASGGSE
jgi:hypothetical protein